MRLGANAQTAGTVIADRDPGIALINLSGAFMTSANPLRRAGLKALASALVAAGFAVPALAQNTIKVGVLHSLSGTMAISETVLKDTVLMAIDEINAKGGVLGKKLEPVVVDPASNWPLFAEKAKQLISQDKVAAVFGCWTSVSRKSVLPVFEQSNALLFYPVQYEGEELSPNVFYTGAAPNQQAIPAVEYLMSKDGGGAKRFVLLGTDYVYPRDQQDPARFPEGQGHCRCRHPGGVHALRPLRLPEHHRQDQEVLERRQEDGGGVHHQRRLQRALLQGAGQPRPEGQGRASGGLLGR
jgi:ABC-type branched-subunit amino acid transport system substrate-binding protein